MNNQFGQLRAQGTIPATLEAALKFSSPTEPQLQGNISPDYQTVLQALLDEASLELQVSCSFEDDSFQSKKKQKGFQGDVKCSLSIILYGPLPLADEVGEFCQDWNIYLQDPQGCNRDVRYCNPHRLSSSNIQSLPMTSNLGLPPASMDMPNLEEITQQAELLAILNSQGDLPEANQPDAIETSLQS